MDIGDEGVLTISGMGDMEDYSLSCDYPWSSSIKTVVIGNNKTPICPNCGIRESLESIGVNEKEQEKILGIIHSCKANID